MMAINGTAYNSFVFIRLILGFGLLVMGIGYIKNKKSHPIYKNGF
jgi:hypothetical protein